uniref:Retrotransposon protein, putative, unclassified n=1 Tax=Oryza sativa subsp. japonica TaxID=39947 RepID=Q2R4D1_ORYSJ|nr:retrotransposon protein, putative, unclassified [Oryza sativa Japonica Group]
MLVKVVVQRGGEPMRRKERPARRRRRSGEIRATPWPGRERGRHCDVNGGDGDIGRRTGDEQQPAGDGEVVATPLDAGEDASPVLSPRNGGLTEGEEAAATPGEVAAQPEGARVRREVRLEVAGAEKRGGRRREGSSGGHLAKRRASRGGGGGGDAGGGDGAAGRRSGEAGEAAGGRPAPEREREKVGRGGAATGELGKRLKR